jgi:hypothetical protein
MPNSKKVTVYDFRLSSITQYELRQESNLDLLSFG